MLSPLPANVLFTYLKLNLIHALPIFSGHGPFSLAMGYLIPTFYKVECSPELIYDCHNKNSCDGKAFDTGITYK